MKKRLKLFSLSLSIMLSFGLLLAGVYASVTRNIGITGQVSFTSTALRLDFEVKTTSYTGYPSSSSPNYSNTLLSESFGSENQGLTKTGDLGTIQLNDLNNNFAFKILLTSKETHKNIKMQANLPSVVNDLQWLDLEIKRDNATITHDNTSLSYILNSQQDLSNPTVTQFEFIFSANPLLADYLSEVTLNTTFDFEITTESQSIPTEGLNYSKMGDGYYVDYGSATDEDVVIPDTYEGLPVTGISDFGFQDENITSIVLPSGLLFIGEWAFSRCNLSSLVIPANVHIINAYAFEDNFNLTSVTILRSVTEFASINSFDGDVFEGSPLTEILVPADSVAAYKNLSQLSNYVNIIKAIP